MKYLYLFVAILFQTACAVELRDRHQKQPLALTQLTVEKEYSLSVPLIQSEQVTLRLDRLVLGPESEFITQGLNVRLEIGELISEGGTIRSFRSDQMALPGQEGRRGGNIEIMVGKASGSLNLIMQGEHGGRGLEGKAPDDSLRGAKGTPGREALYVRTLEGAAGPGWRRARKAEDGGPGGLGLPGYPGGDGSKGGDSGTALVKITQAENFTLRSQKIPGRGGLGGAGGAGGPGGPGGEPGVDKYPSMSKSYPLYTVPGPVGSPGPQGPAGSSGPAGYEEKLCFQIGEEGLRCE